MSKESKNIAISIAIVILLVVGLISELVQNDGTWEKYRFRCIVVRIQSSFYKIICKLEQAFVLSYIVYIWHEAFYESPRITSGQVDNGSQSLV